MNVMCCVFIVELHEAQLDLSLLRSPYLSLTLTNTLTADLSWSAWPSDKLEPMDGQKIHLVFSGLAFQVTDSLRVHVLCTWALTLHCVRHRRPLIQ